MIFKVARGSNRPRAGTLALLLTASFASASSHAIVSPGLNNLGNTCYLNSQLECAFHIPKVRSLIESPPRQSVAPPEDSKSSEEVASEEKKEGDETLPTDDANVDAEDSKDAEPPEEKPESPAIQALRKVFLDLKSSSTAVTPRLFCQILGIPVMEQQDSQEFWKLLLPALSITSLTDLYQGAFEAYITAADGSGRERIREETFLDLSLDVSKSSVLEGLEASFGSPELLSVAEGNGWRPEKGADKVDAYKGQKLRVQGLPSILQLHLLRFKYDWQTDQMSKINTRCSFPEELDLGSLCGQLQESEKEQAKYALQSVVIHVGEYSSGHYYAYVRPDMRSNDWYRFNDHVVTKVTIDEVFADAYGGKNPCDKSKGAGPIRWLKSIFSPREDPFGFGGRTSNAYVVNYVRCCDIPSLYSLDCEEQ